MNAAQRYLHSVFTILTDIALTESDAILEAARHVAASIEAGGLVHTFGTGHSHLIAEELFYRAGGLGAINPILDEQLMLHVAAEQSTRLERRAEMADQVLERHRFEPSDCLIVASNSGGNAVCEGIARRAREVGVAIIVILSRRHQAGVVSSRPGPGLVDLADVIIDNHGEVGDACVDIDGLATKVAASSTVAGAAIVNAVMAAAIEMLVDRGCAPDVFSSANVPGGDEKNAAIAARYRPRVRSL